MRSLVLVLVLCIALPAGVAWSSARHEDRTPRAADRGVSGELDRYDAVGNTVTLRIDGRTARFQLSPGTVLQEGANIITVDRLNEFRGHFTKVTVASDGRTVARLMISPEEVVTGEIAAYNPAKHKLRVSTATGSKEFPIGADAWCHLGAETIDAAMLGSYVDHNVKVTVSQRSGEVLSIFVSKKSE